MQQNVSGKVSFQYREFKTLVSFICCTRLKSESKFTPITANWLVRGLMSVYMEAYVIGL